MSAQKRSSCAGASDAKRPKVQVRTVEKWIQEYDKSLNTSLWLKFKKSDRDHVLSLHCAVCIQFKDKLVSMRNFRPAFIEGTRNIKTSSFKDRAATDMHGHAMTLLKKQLSSTPTEYAPIAKAMASSTMDKVTTECMKRKFDVAYTIAKENLAFTKMKPLCELEERHGAQLGQGYKNDRACSMFIEYIARDQQERLVATLSKAHFFSIQIDSSTDAGNADDELFLVLYFDPHSSDGTVHVWNSFLCVRQLKCATAVGVFDCLKAAMEYVGVLNWADKMIGLGCDGTDTNIGERAGVKALIKEDMPWMVVFWCLAHRLELSIKDALCSTHFKAIDELLLQVYYVYENSPKKCQELEDIVTELKSCLEPDDMPTKGGSRPLRASGTRFVAHKVAALGRLVDRFGAYISHLTALVEDPGVRSTHKQKLKGYIKKWQKFKILIGCAFFNDLLRPAAILCKTLQEDNLCTLRAIEAVMKTKKALDKLEGTKFEELPTVSKVISRIKQQQDGGVTYQGVNITYYQQGMAFVKSNHVEWVRAVESCLKDRLKTDVELLTHAVTLLATNGWERSEKPSFGYTALTEVTRWFQVPLERANVDISLVQEEWDDMVEYGKQYLNLVQEDYRVIWWKLFNAVDAKQWSNVLLVIELLFCLPMANGRLERVFSYLKLIKNNRRTSLKDDTLDNLLRINVEGPALSNWDATHAVDLWCRDKVRRVNHGDSRSNPKCGPSTTEETETYKFSLNDWEEWIGIADRETIDDDIDTDVDTESNNDDTNSIMNLEL